MCFTRAKDSEKETQLLQQLNDKSACISISGINTRTNEMVEIVRRISA